MDVLYLYQQLRKRIINNQTNDNMTSITITINGKKAGQKVFFKLILTAANFMKVVEMTFNTLEDILNGEKQGLYTIEK